MTDFEVIEAMMRAVETDPSSAALRVHLATLLSEAGRHAEALNQLEPVLFQDPTNLTALMAAAKSAQAVGDVSRSDGYRRILRALGEQAIPPTEDRAPSQSDVPPVGPIDPPKVKKLRVVDAESERLEEVWEIEKPQISLADVGGMEAVKKRLSTSFLAPMRNPEIGAAFGKSLRGGLLMFGPPGCGKTYIARALAGELEAHFISVGLSEVLDMWLGQTEKNIHAVFEMARRHRPTVLFFDEVDAIGRKRVNLAHQAGRNAVNQLLSEMDGIDAENDGIFILGATNHPWDIDAALMRPGRFDRYILVLPPDLQARAAILEHHLVGRPIEAIDFASLAAATDGYSGADLALLCESAAELAMEEALESGVVRPILQQHLTRARRDARPTTRQWFETAKNFAIFANQAGMFDELVDHMRARKML